MLIKSLRHLIDKSKPSHLMIYDFTLDCYRSKSTYLLRVILDRLFINKVPQRKCLVISNPLCLYRFVDESIHRALLLCEKADQLWIPTVTCKLGLNKRSSKKKNQCYFHNSMVCRKARNDSF